MIGVVALVRVKEGKGEELEAIFAELFALTSRAISPTPFRVSKAPPANT
jgi:hypothetical protein